MARVIDWMQSLNDFKVFHCNNVICMSYISQNLQKTFTNHAGVSKKTLRDW